MSSPYEKIAAWLESKAKLYPLEVELCHSRGGVLDRLSFAENETGADLVDRIVELATDDASSQGMGPQTYWILLRKIGDSETQGRRSLTIDPKSDEVRGNETPDAMGLTTQTMRHMENNQRMLLQSVERLVSNVQRENDRMQSFQLERDRTEVERMALQRQLAHDVAAQRVEEARIEAEAKRNEWLMRQVEVLLPIGVAKLFGGETSQNFAEEGKLLLTFAKTLSPAQLERIAGALDPSMRTLLAEIASGGIAAPFLPLAVQRLMVSVTMTQLESIQEILETPEQKQAFWDLFNTRVHTLRAAVGEPKALERPPLPQLANGHAVPEGGK